MAIANTITYGLNEASSILGVNPTTLRNYVANGCPIISQSPWEFSIPDVIDWLNIVSVQKATKIKSGAHMSYEQARTRKMIAEAEMAEMALAHQRGLVAPIDEVIKQVGDQFSTIKAKLLAYPSGAATRFAAIDDWKVIQQAMTDDIRNILEELIGYEHSRLERIEQRTSGEIDSDDAGEAPAASTTKRKRVGRPRKNALPGE